MALAEMEKLVRLALDHGLIGPERRRQLMDGLPLGFVYSLPTVSRPIDQLRFDLMELERTPRLIGLDRPPLAVWLENAATMCATEGRAAPAQVFAEAADRVQPGGRAMQRIAGMLGGGSEGSSTHIGSVSGGGVGVAHGPVTINNNTTHNYAPAPLAPGAVREAQPPSNSAGIPRHRRLRVMQIHPDTRMAWRTLDPPLDPQSRVHAVQTLKGQWHRKYPPSSRIWHEVVENLDAACDQIGREAGPHDCLVIFARLPEALAALLGARLHEELGIIPAVVICERRWGSRDSRWRPWGPAWSAPVMPAGDPALYVDGLPARIPDDLAVVVDIERSISEAGVTAALVAAGVLDAPRVRITRVVGEGDQAPPTPEVIERLCTDLDAFTARLRAQHGRLETLHVFYHGPLPLMVRWAQRLYECPFRVVVYTDQPGGKLVPAVQLGDGLPAELVAEEAAPPTEVDGYDAFIAYASPSARYADALYDALTQEGLTVFLDRRSMSAGELWQQTLPAALSKSRAVVALISPLTQPAWYQQVEFARAIEHVRRSEGTRRLIPVLHEGTRRQDLPYGLEIVVPFDGNGKDAYTVGRELARIVGTAAGAPGAEEAAPSAGE